MINEKELSRTVGVQVMIDQSRVVIVDGETIVAKSYVLHCPSCGRVVQVFNNQGVSLADVVNICQTNKEELLNNFTYCPKCGQKLNYDVGIMDATYEEHKEAVEETVNG